MLTIPYELVEVDPEVEVEGAEIRATRLEAGYTSQESFAIACGWWQSEQCKYEKPGKHRMPLAKIMKMIRVCNGSE